MDSDNGLNTDLRLTESTLLKNFDCSHDNVHAVLNLLW